MKALLDGDIWQWEFGSATDDEHKPIPWPILQQRIQGRINSILEAVGADEYQIYLTSDDKSNFRYDVATIKPYKGNRKDIEKPFWYAHIRNFLVDQRGAIEVFDMEADDAISIEMYKNYYESKLASEESGQFILPDVVCCSRDKDLRMVPGWHYSWAVGNSPERPIYMVSENVGNINFYSQLLTGDPTDNIPGLFGVGKNSALLRNMECFETNYERYKYVLSEYTKRFGSYASLFLEENARLLHMCKGKANDWTAPQPTRSAEVMALSNDSTAS